ncbi:MAG: class B sortase [Bacillota bacterium]
MFGDLGKYEDSSYFQEHPVIRFDTLYERGEYEIVAVFLSQVYRKSDDVFKYYQFLEADTQVEFDAFVSNINALSLYDTGVDAKFGDTFITLSTCAYHTENGRLVVIARKR